MRYALPCTLTIALLSGCQTGHPEPTAGGGTVADGSLTASMAAHEEYPEPQTASLRSFIELARRDVQTQKAAIIADNMVFTEPEAAEFWPIYREYEAALYRINSHKFSMIDRFLPSGGQITDGQARELANEALEIDEQRVALKREYFSKFQEAIPASKAARFFQIENQLNAVIDLRLAAALPLIK